MQLYIIRHGQSENNALWGRTGSSQGRSEDPDLTETGRQQAERLAQFLGQRRASVPENVYDLKNIHGFGFTHLYCSPMIRAVETAMAIARAIELRAAVWPELHEVGGIFVADGETDERVGLPGRDRVYFEARYPDLVLPDPWAEEGWWNRPFEERAQRLPRARRFLRDLLVRHGGGEDRVAVVSHGGFHSYLLAAILDLPKRDTLWFSMNNTAITRVDLNEGQIAIVYTNRTDFLPDELLT